MLKIRDNVDLKELQKFGFETINIAGKIKYQLVKRVGKNEIYNIKIDEYGIIRINILSVFNELPSVIYDLIKADLVEKV